MTRNRFLLLALILCGWFAFGAQAWAGSAAKIQVRFVLDGAGGDDLGFAQEEQVAPGELAKQRGGEAISVATIPGAPGSTTPRIILWDEVKQLPSPNPSTSASSGGQAINQRVIQIR